MNHTDNKRGILFNRKTQTGKGTSAANQASAASKRAKQLTKRKRSSSNKVHTTRHTTDPQPRDVPTAANPSPTFCKTEMGSGAAGSRCRYGGGVRRGEKLEPNGALAAAWKHAVIKLHAPKNTPLDCTKRWSEFGKAHWPC